MRKLEVWRRVQARARLGGNGEWDKEDGWSPRIVESEDLLAAAACITNRWGRSLGTKVRF